MTIGAASGWIEVRPVVLLAGIFGLTVSCLPSQREVVLAKAGKHCADVEFDSSKYSGPGTLVDQGQCREDRFELVIPVGLHDSAQTFQITGLPPVCFRANLELLLAPRDRRRERESLPFPEVSIVKNGTRVGSSEPRGSVDGWEWRFAASFDGPVTAAFPFRRFSGRSDARSAYTVSLQGLTRVPDTAVDARLVLLGSDVAPDGGAACPSW